MRKGEVWWANVDDPSGRRPVLLLSRNSTYGQRTYCTVATVSTRIRAIRSEVQLGRRDGMPYTCAANLDDIITIGQASIDEQITSLSAAKLREVEQAIHFVFGLSF